MKKLSFSKIKILEFTVALLLIIIGVILRFLPHFPNFTPVAALALFGGVYLSRKLALVLPLSIMVISDAFLGHYELSLMLTVYVSFLICVLLGFWLRNHKKIPNVIMGAVASSLTFFILTNFAVWFFTTWYPKDFSGLIQCYLMALPFFRNTFLGDLFYVTLFFGSYEAVVLLARKKIKTLAEIKATINK